MNDHLGCWFRRSRRSSLPSSAASSAGEAPGDSSSGSPRLQGERADLGSFIAVGAAVEVPRHPWMPERAAAKLEAILLGQ
jgi:hypothetical protein